MIHSCKIAVLRCIFQHSFDHSKQQAIRSNHEGCAWHTGQSQPYHHRSTQILPWSVVIAQLRTTCEEPVYGLTLCLVQQHSFAVQLDPSIENTYE